MSGCVRLSLRFGQVCWRLLLAVDRAATHILFLLATFPFVCFVPHTGIIFFLESKDKFQSVRTVIFIISRSATTQVRCCEGGDEVESDRFISLKIN